MKIRVAFISNDMRQMKYALNDFIEVNAGQIEKIDKRTRSIMMNDGTIIQGISCGARSLKDCHYEQIIVATDRRGTSGWRQQSRKFFEDLQEKLYPSDIPEEKRVVYYDIDSEDRRYVSLHGCHTMGASVGSEETQ